MKRLLKASLGLNVASFIHLARLRPKLFVRAAIGAFTTARNIAPQNTKQLQVQQIPQVSVCQILGDRRPAIRLTVMRYEDGMLPTEEAMALLALLVAEAPDEVLEIGTYMGHTTRLIAENLESAVIHTVDLPEGFSPETDQVQNLPKDDFHLIARRIVGREFRESLYASRIKQHFADTAIWDFHAAGRPTFFFIDGSHSYEYCKSDSEKCFELCGGRGVFLWHDCDDDHPGVVKFICEWRSQGRDIVRISGTCLAYWKSI